MIKFGVFYKVTIKTWYDILPTFITVMGLTFRGTTAGDSRREKSRSVIITRSAFRWGRGGGGGGYLIYGRVIASRIVFQQ